MGVFQPLLINWTGIGEPKRLRAIKTSHNFPSLLGLKTMLGRHLQSDEFKPGKSPVVVLSYGFWNGQLGARTDILGEGLMLDGQPHVRVGVSAAGVKLASLVGFEPAVMLPLIKELLSRLRGAFAVERVGLATALPTYAILQPFSIAGLDESHEAQLLAARFTAVSFDYLQTLQIGIKAGRLFQEADSANAPLVAVINE
jgi:hypothetical protein